MRLPAAVHEALVADTARAMARRTPAVAKAAAQIRAEENHALLDNVLPENAIVGVDYGKGKDRAAVVVAHMEGPVMVVDHIRHYCPEHAFTPPENSGLSFCPFCELEAMEQVAIEGATP